MKTKELFGVWEEVAERIRGDVKHVVKSYSSRETGGEGERQTAEYFADRLGKCSSATIKKFSVQPDAYMGWLPILVICVFLAYAAYFFSTMLSLLLLVCGALPFLLQYVLCLRALDPLYKSRESQNVIATRRCSQEVKKRVYLVAHYDATYESSIKYRFGATIASIHRWAGAIGIVFYFALSIARWAIIGGLGAGIAEGVMLYLGLAGGVFLIPVFGFLFLISRKLVIDGANDDLSGCFVATEVLEALDKLNISYKNTEVSVLLTGGGAVGSRGAGAFIDDILAQTAANATPDGEAKIDGEDKGNAHAKIDGSDGCETYYISLDCLREASALNVCTSNAGNFVKSDKDVVKLISDAASDADIKCGAAMAPFSFATDSFTFSRRGFKSAAIVGLNTKLPDYYRTRYDSYDNLGEECISSAYELALTAIEKFADEGDDIRAFFKAQKEAVKANEKVDVASNGEFDNATSDSAGVNAETQAVAPENDKTNL